MVVWDFQKNPNISEHFNPNQIKNSNVLLPPHPFSHEAVWNGSRDSNQSLIIWNA